jgi:hypothetical protein
MMIRYIVAFASGVVFGASSVFFAYVLPVWNNPSESISGIHEVKYKQTFASLQALLARIDQQTLDEPLKVVEAEISGRKQHVLVALLESERIEYAGIVLDADMDGLGIISIPRTFELKVKCFQIRDAVGSVEVLPSVLDVISSRCIDE